MPTLNWIGKEAVIHHHHEAPFHLLTESTELSTSEPGCSNLLVEGDNLLALKALLPYYAGQVKCIYIDPPYNTGNEKWIYNDNVNSPEIRKWLGKVVGGELEDLSRHDKWLCMMYPRLALLRQMLREDGAIFISIDDNEKHHLRAIMNEIFGEKNFITTVIWEKNYAPKASAKYLSENHDYILIYAKSKSNWKRNLLPRDIKQNKAYKNMDGDPRGLWRPNNLAARNPYSLGIYSITCPSGRIIQGPPKGSFWRVSKAKFDELDRDGRIWWGKDGNNVPAPKVFLSEVQQGVVPMTIWPYSEAGHTQDAKKEILSIFEDDQEIFSTPKPTKLLLRILQLATNSGDIILDSFAGSGTTGHAVMHLNQQDGGNRRFILVEMDADICRNVTAERLRRVCAGYGKPDGTHVSGLGGGFRFCALGTPCFDEEGKIKPEISFADLGRHLFFTETGQPLPENEKPDTPLVGIYLDTAVYLLYNGVLKDKRPGSGNALTHAMLAGLPVHDGPKVIYGTSCRLSKTRLKENNIVFKQIPYGIRVR
jgi:adenine-specific DNA-methyltransferase